MTHHSVPEQRFLTVGLSSSERTLIVAHTDRGDSIRIISARQTTQSERKYYEETSSRRKTKDELRREYDLSQLKGSARGKYLDRYRKGTNLVLLSPDVAQYFPDEKSVNSALRTLIHIARRRSR